MLHPLNCTMAVTGNDFCGSGIIIQSLEQSSKASAPVTNKKLGSVGASARDIEPVLVVHERQLCRREANPMLSAQLHIKSTAIMSLISCMCTNRDTFPLNLFIVPLKPNRSLSIQGGMFFLVPLPFGKPSNLFTFLLLSLSPTHTTSTHYQYYTARRKCATVTG